MKDDNILKSGEKGNRLRKWDKSTYLCLRGDDKELVPINIITLIILR